LRAAAANVRNFGQSRPGIFFTLFSFTLARQRIQAETPLVNRKLLGNPKWMLWCTRVPKEGDRIAMAYQTINPYTEELVKTFPEHTDAQLQTILAKAKETYENDWSLRSLAERKAIVKKAASIMRRDLEKFAMPITLEMGKLFGEAKGEVELSADILEYYADNGEKFLAPEKLKVAEGEAFMENEPLGVLFCIEPWNFPYY
jgi:acyl-CoA reductase-like NAD-dependent aldehyde dehydrogenase